MGIEEKFNKLNPAGQRAVMEFIEFLLFREAKHPGTISQEDEYEEEEIISSPDLQQAERKTPGDLSSGKSDNSGIILAEELIIDDKEDIIDFADINTRFSRKEKEEDTPRPVRKRHMFDWL